MREATSAEWRCITRRHPPPRWAGSRRPCHLADREPQAPGFLLEAGVLAEENGPSDEAKELYESIAGTEASSEAIVE